jgi:hypothetical protein
MGLCIFLGSLAALQGLESCRGNKAEHTAAVAEGEANAHVQQAAAIPSHAEPLAKAQAGVDRARAKVAGAGKRVAAQPSVPISASTHADPADNQPLVLPDPGTADLVSAQDVLIAELRAALADEQRRSEQYRLAFEAERRRAVGLQIALDAQKHVQGASRWRGRIEGFAVGVATGFLGGKL